jgi:hypothetical protein
VGLIPLARSRFEVAEYSDISIVLAQETVSFGVSTGGWRQSRYIQVYWMDELYGRGVWRELLAIDNELARASQYREHLNGTTYMARHDLRHRWDVFLEIVFGLVIRFDRLDRYVT